MGTFLRLFVAAPIAFIVTAIIFLGLYNQLSPKPFLYTTPEEPQAIYLGNEILCMCRPPGTYDFLPSMPQPDVSNVWTTSEKAVQKAPTVETEAPSNTIQIYSQLNDGTSPCAGQSTLIDPPQVSYPQSCVAKGAEGRVVVRYDINENGLVRNITIVESVDECFNQPLLDALSNRQYPPYCTQEGNPTRRLGVIETYSFTLSD
jgi:TonB family protein